MELLSTNDLNHIITAVDANTSVFKTCELFKSTGVHEPHLLGIDTEYMEHSSASLTDLVKTKINIPEMPLNTNAFLKIWFAWNDLLDEVEDDETIVDRIVDFYSRNPRVISAFLGLDRDDFIDAVTDVSSSTSLNHEANIYDYITKNIIQQNISPNFIPLLLYNKCNISSIIQSLNTISDFKRKSILINKLKLLHNMFPTLNLKFIMTGSAPTVIDANSFFTSIKDGKIVIEQSEYSSIIFQFFHAHYIMSIFGIVHNDNHMGNVLIQTLPIPVSLDITIGDARIQFTTRYIVKFFDWDRAYYTMGPENQLTSSFLHTRNVDRFTPGRDFSAFICFLSDMNITGFDIILENLIVGPKPTSNSNQPLEIKIKGGVTLRLKQWIVGNPVISDKEDPQTKYITISKPYFEYCLPLVVDTLRKKLGVDKNGVSIYDNVTNVYLGVNNNDVFIYQGYTCHPMYDSDLLQVEQFFLNKDKLSTLCLGLVNGPHLLSYRYTLSHPLEEATRVGNLIYARKL